MGWVALHGYNCSHFRSPTRSSRPLRACRPVHMVGMPEDSPPVRLVYTLGGDPLIEFFMAPTTEGFCFGLADPSIGDIHLTVLFKEGKVRSSLKDPSRDPDRFSGRTFTPDVLAKKIENRVRRWVKPYHPNMVAWVMRPALKRKLARLVDFRWEGDEMHIPLEVVYGKIVLDFWNSRRWKRVRIRELLDNPHEVGARVEGSTFYIIRPIDRHHMVKASEGQLAALDNLVMEHLGFDEYRDYAAEKVKAKVEAEGEPDSWSRLRASVRSPAKKVSPRLGPPPRI